MFKKPNFFIIGAPKCGTTSLAVWLSEHPRVYMSHPKEPAFFNHDQPKRFIDTLTRYESYFNGVAEQHLSIGEASTGYLRSEVAVNEILHYSPQVKFVVGLRNPIDMAVSWHGQQIFEAFENELDFMRAWSLQDERREGRSVPKLCVDVSGLLYCDVCSLGAQMARLYSIVPQDRILIYTLDEMRDDPRGLWLRLLEFLGVPDDGRGLFPALNEAKNVPSPVRIAARIVGDLKRIMGLSRYELGLLRYINFKKRRVRLSNSFRVELSNHFREDIFLLGKVTGRDFSAWLEDRTTLEGVADNVGGQSSTNNGCQGEDL